jgi:hypothetical protein
MNKLFQKFNGDFFDGFDPKTPYQMVPVHNIRDVGIVAPDDCSISVDDDSIITLANVRTQSGLMAIPGDVTNQISVSKNTRVQFSIVGKVSGNARGKRD